MNRRRIRNLPTIADMAKAFGAVDGIFDKLEQGWIHDIQGHPVFRNATDGRWYDIPEALAGWISLWERIVAKHGLDIDLKPIAKLAARLKHGVPLQPAEVAQCVEIVKQCKRAYKRMDVYEIGSLVKTQLIANEVEMQGITV